MDNTQTTIQTIAGSDGMASSDFLTSLIATGSDAQSNLFTAILDFSNNGFPEEFNLRLIKVSLPVLENKLVDLPYQNTSVQIPSSGTSVDRTVKMTMRLDSNYMALQKLYGHMLLNNNSIYLGKDPSKSFTATIKLWSWTDDSMQEQVSYNFQDCYFTKVPSLEMDYSASRNITIPLTFVYSRYEMAFVSNV